MADPGRPPLRGLLVDYGGVLTSGLSEALDVWAERDRVDPTTFVQVMLDWLGPEYGAAAAAHPVHAVERGEIAVPDFERQLAARLRTADGQPVEPVGLLDRMFAAFRREPEMVGVVRRARVSGLRTALVSNSWSLNYPRADWAELFDAVVISGEVGLRKPESAIYRHAAAEVGLAPAQCVFVDDLAVNVHGAVAAGMVGVQHRTPAETVRELEALFGRRLTDRR